MNLKTKSQLKACRFGLDLLADKYMNRGFGKLPI